jgi:hypothetical protein
MLASCVMAGTVFYPVSGDITLNYNIRDDKWVDEDDSRCLNIKFDYDDYLFKIKKNEKYFTEYYAVGNYDVENKEFELKCRCAEYLSMMIFAAQDSNYAKIALNEIAEYRNSIDKSHVKLNPCIQVEVMF